MTEGKLKAKRLIEVMTPFPYVVSSDTDVREAEALMEEHDIRHLGVMEGGALVGVLSHRDLRAAQSLRMASGTAQVRVDQLHSHPVYKVPEDTPLLEVVQNLARRRLGCALVTRAGKLIGIVTTTDICRLYAEALTPPLTIPPETA